MSQPILIKRGLLSPPGDTSNSRITTVFYLLNPQKESQRSRGVAVREERIDLYGTGLKGSDAVSSGESALPLRASRPQPYMYSLEGRRLDLHPQLH